MTYIILAILCLLVSIFASRVARLSWFGGQAPGWVESALTWGGGGLAVIWLLSTSFVSISEDETGHIVKIYGFRSLPTGRIIATETGMAGPQADTIPPGVHFSFLINVLNKVEKLPVFEVPDGKYGFLTARDGAPLREGQSFADPVIPEEFKKMVTDAQYFLAHGGQMGPQASVLPPGKYRINRYLWDARLDDATEVEKGFVAVVKSNVLGAVNMGNLVSPKPAVCATIAGAQTTEGGLAVPIVPVGCIGIWETALQPARYYINRRAYVLTLVDSRVQRWEYKGGYKKRMVEMKVSPEGKLDQTERSMDVPVPEGAADPAVFAKVEGWDVPIELRILAQVTPADAPYVVASVGGLQEVEDKILTPTIRAVVRDVSGSSIEINEPVYDLDGNAVMENGSPKLVTLVRKTRILDFITHRPAIEETMRRVLKPEGAKVRVEIKEIRLGESVLPPEVLIPPQRKQLAEQLAVAYEQEKNAQNQRVSAEQARATADQQNKLVEAQIEQQRSLLMAQAKKNEGEGEKSRLLAIAEGQRSQANALGEERVMELRKFELSMDKLFDFLNRHPDVLTTALSNAQKFVPERVFTIGSGEGNNAVGAFGVLGELLNSARESSPKQNLPEKK